MPHLQVQSASTSKLRDNPNNVRMHPKRQINKLADAIRQFGFRVPTEADSDTICDTKIVNAKRARFVQGRGKRNCIQSSSLPGPRISYGFSVRPYPHRLLLGWTKRKSRHDQDRRRKPHERNPGNG